MIAPLRRRHRAVFLLLALLLPGVLGASLFLRTGPVRPSALPSIAGATTRPSRWGLTAELDMRGSFEGVVVPSQDAPLQPELRYVETFEEGRSGVLERCAVELVLPSGNEPDTFVYWVSELAADREALPADARLIGGPLGYGEAANYGFVLGPEERLGPGHLVLFSVARGRIVFSQSIETTRVDGGGIY